ncbi:MAG: hypothetical protein K6F52_04630 [Clostridia bacterium]|nr:hypothetical protein [Clostridia bacterium]
MAEKEKSKIGLKFGTAGIRALMGEGADRLNIHTVAHITEGVAAYMKEAHLKRRVIIGYDTRINSREFAFVTASVLRKSGIEVICFEKYLPVPLLAFGTRLFGCGAGIMITASHNPKEYNGYKIYDRFGCQLCDDEAEKVMQCIGRRSFRAYSAANESPATPEGSADSAMPAGAAEAEVSAEFAGEAGSAMETLYTYLTKVYIKTLKAQITDVLGIPEQALSKLRAAYTPLNGTGLSFVKEALFEAGMKPENLFVVKPQEKPDGEFPTCPYPNPEKTEALKLGLELAEEKEADLLVATDPDADRLGVAVAEAAAGTDAGSPEKAGGEIEVAGRAQTAAGTDISGPKKPGGENGAACAAHFARLTGNEVALLMFDFICAMHAAQGTMPKNPVALRTIVSSPLMDIIARKYGVSVRTTLTGFKHIGALMAGIRPDEDDFERRFRGRHRVSQMDDDTVVSGNSADGSENGIGSGNGSETESGTGSENGTGSGNGIGIGSETGSANGCGSGSETGSGNGSETESGTGSENRTGSSGCPVGHEETCRPGSAGELSPDCYGDDPAHIFSFEESCGYLPAAYIRDKDGIASALVSCIMAAYYKEKGLTLRERMNQIYEEYGYMKNDLLEYNLEGEEGKKNIEKIMDDFRNTPPDAIDGERVTKRGDYRKGEIYICGDSSRCDMVAGTRPTNQPKANVLEYATTQGNSFLMRPSGTEPKLKIYIYAMGDEKLEAVRREVKARIDGLIS